MAFWVEERRRRTEGKMDEPSATAGAERAKQKPYSTAKRVLSGSCGVSPLEGVGLHDAGVSPRGRLSPSEC